LNQIPPGVEPSEAGNGELRAGGVLAQLAWGLRSTAGEIREHNEDFAGAHAPSGPDDVLDATPLFLVADGMGGHAAGEVASRTAVESLLEEWRSNEADDVSKALRAAARKANTAVYDASLTNSRSGMGTTLTALALSGREAVIAHVGDSRAYLVRGDSCRQLTSDHSRVGEMLRMKLITPEQAARHPARSQLTRTIGTDINVQVDILREPLRDGDTFLLCSDGLWDEVAAHEIAAAARSLLGPGPDAMVAAEQLVATAVSRGAADNVTAVLVRVVTVPPVPASGAKRSFFRRGRP